MERESQGGERHKSKIIHTHSHFLTNFEVKI